PERDSITDNCAYAVRHIAGCMERIGLPHSWAFRPAYRGGECYGATSIQLDELYRPCDALLNVVAATDLRVEHLAASLRVYVEGGRALAELHTANGDAHTAIALENQHAIVTYGENFGAADCRVPIDGRLYGKTRQPVDLDHWPMAYEAQALFFTTIGNYR